jgi:hypothetical protein
VPFAVFQGFAQHFYLFAAQLSVGEWFFHVLLGLKSNWLKILVAQNAVALLECIQGGIVGYASYFYLVAYF